MLTLICPVIAISIHALLAESDVDKIPYQRQIDQFLSTLSLRRATVMHALEFANFMLFLSTLSLRRATEATKSDQGANDQFLSTLSLRRATREPTALRTPHQRFLSTLSLRRATRAASITPAASRNFYPRSPCGERPKAVMDNIIFVPGFLSTLSLRRATISARKPCSRSSFLSTLSLRRATQRRQTF